MRQSRRQFLRSCLRFGAACWGGLSFGALGAWGARAPGRRKRAAFEPGYLELHRRGELKRRARSLWDIMVRCELCPRECVVARQRGREGFCGATSRLVISSAHPHFGEERSLVGEGGSGTVFFSHCALRCVFCINWEISHAGRGRPRRIRDLADMMLRLQERGCHNVNVVTPSHYSPHILYALDIAASEGLRLPLVYNTCGYERLKVLKILDGVVDIYLPDLKYSDGSMAKRYSAGALDYPVVARAALLEMQRQVGVAKPGPDGLMRRGLMVRHLVMPNNVGGSKDVVRWIAGHLPKETYLNIMSQYRPMHKARMYPKISRRITREEYREVVDAARKAGLTNLDVQGEPVRRDP